MTQNPPCIKAALALTLSCAFASQATAAPPLPERSGTPKRSVTDTYHEQQVREDYRWLEDAKDPEVRKWSDEQNRRARAALDSVPAMAAIRKRMQELELSTSPAYFDLLHRGGTLFALKAQPPKQQPFVVTLKSPDDPASERVIVDPNKLNAQGTTAIDFYVPSLDGKLVAVSLSEKGSEMGTVHVFEVQTGKELPDKIPHAHGGTAGGSLDWARDGAGFYYTRYPQAGERPKEDLDFYQQVYFHKLGTDPAQDRYAIGKDFPRIAEVALRASDDGKYLLASVANGDGGEFAHHVLTPQGRWVQVSSFADKVIAAAFGRSDDLYLVSRNGSPHGKVLRLPLSDLDLKKAQIVVPESAAVIGHIEPTNGTLYVVDLLGGPSQVRAINLTSGKGSATSPAVSPAFSPATSIVPLPAISSVGEILRLEGNEVVFNSQTFIEPAAWYRYAPDRNDGKPRKTALFRTSPADFRDSEVVREFATSKDGTKVPMSIIRKKGTRLDHNNPTILYGYGGYSLSLSPAFSTSRRVWIEQGGVYAVANLRGGGEFGEEWHAAGNLVHKQNVFDDFAACARYLIDKGYTKSEKLAIWGGSNGGLLMGAALTQHPDLYRAVISKAGIYDMLRVELSPNGAFNVTEFGTVKDKDQFKALLGYSPYHQVKNGTAYPAVLFLTGDHDPRVDPANSRKMTARLQEATSSPRPVLLRTSNTSGHGMGTSLSERIAETADAYGFLFQQLGVSYHPIKTDTTADGKTLSRSTP